MEPAGPYGLASASATSPACPATFTGDQIAPILPVSSIRNVLRMVPCTGFPYIIFFPKAPYSFATALSGSDSNGNGSSSFRANFWCDAIESLETPYTTAPADFTRANASRKSSASRVQPGVASFG